MNNFCGFFQRQSNKVLSKLVAYLHIHLVVNQATWLLRQFVQEILHIQFHTSYQHPSQIISRTSKNPCPVLFNALKISSLQQAQFAVSNHQKVSATTSRVEEF
jgi:hypothetical protein